MDIEQTTMRRVTLRIVPLLLICYFAAYLDRVNVSFAALQMNKDIGLSNTAYGFGAGLFFLAYFICEVPSNLVLHRVGARRWIARIMLTWGLCAGAMAFVRGPTSFNVARFLLGAAEAGFFPGVIFYLTLWFPATYRARIVGYFMAAVPICGTIGSPISGMLLNVRGYGLAGWQWLFLLEAVPSIILAFVLLAYLTDKPEKAEWLPAPERSWLSQRITGERQRIEKRGHLSVLQALTSPLLLGLSVVYFGDTCLNNANAFFLPQIIKSFHLSNTATGFVTAIPNFFGLVGILWWGLRSDRRGERVGHAATALVVGGSGLLVAALSHNAILSVAALSVAVAGTYAFTPPFWAIATTFTSGAAAAGSIAAISAVGILGGFVAPTIMGYLKDLTGSFAGGQIVIAVFAFLAAALLLIIARWRRDVMLPRDEGLMDLPAMPPARN